MKGALFGDQIEGYKDAFVYNGVYEIANAPIKSCDPQWKTNQSDLDYQMSFGSNTVIQPVDSTSGPIQSAYKTLAKIPKVDSGEEKFDRCAWSCNLRRRELSESDHCTTT
ncbi:hypothetical protein RND81_09G117400 [Saponaria officinalis]|uniref:Uncharacterized protein n=1 Tax=Saponaria officinalis TaxID=3572 RepID=A0AAW1IL98_SAPOF